MYLHIYASTRTTWNLSLAGPEHERQIDPVIAKCEQRKPLLGWALKRFQVCIALDSSMENNDGINGIVLPHSAHVAGHWTPSIDPWRQYHAVLKERLTAQTEYIALNN